MLKKPLFQYDIDKYSESIAKLADKISNPYSFKECNKAKLDIKTQIKLILHIKQLNERINKNEADRSVQAELENILQAI